MTAPARESVPAYSGRPRGRHDLGYEDLVPDLVRFAALSRDDPGRRWLREQLIIGFLPVVRNIARRYSGRGEPAEDLEQAGCIGLLNALERFHTTSETVDYVGAFLGYAIPTITGEIQRHFRDRTWTVRVPRRLKDIQFPMRNAISVLTHTLQRAPRPTEIAAHLRVDVEEVIEALQAQHAHAPDSIDAFDATAPTAVRALGSTDPAFARVAHRPELAQAFRELPSRDRQLIVMRFFTGMTQIEIARELGISQMQVSRLLAQLLATLRQRLDTPRYCP